MPTHAATRRSVPRGRAAGRAGADRAALPGHAPTARRRHIGRAAVRGAARGQPGAGRRVRGPGRRARSTWRWCTARPATARRASIDAPIVASTGGRYRVTIAAATARGSRPHPLSGARHERLTRATASWSHSRNRAQPPDPRAPGPPRAAGGGRSARTAPAGVVPRPAVPARLSADPAASGHRPAVTFTAPLPARAAGARSKTSRGGPMSGKLIVSRPTLAARKQNAAARKRPARLSSASPRPSAVRVRRARPAWRGPDCAAGALRLALARRVPGGRSRRTSIGWSTPQPTACRASPSTATATRWSPASTAMTRRAAPPGCPPRWSRCWPTTTGAGRGLCQIPAPAGQPDPRGADCRAGPAEPVRGPDWANSSPTKMAWPTSPPRRGLSTGLFPDMREMRGAGARVGGRAAGAELLRLHVRLWRRSRRRAAPRGCSTWICRSPSWPGARRTTAPTASSPTRTTSSSAMSLTGWPGWCSAATASTW